MTTEEILTQLRNPGNQIPREALAEVIQRREEFVPLLIAEIEKATELAEEADPDDSLPCFALYLLAELRETRALEPILAWFALDKAEGESMFGDVLAQDAAAMLAALAHDNPARLREYALQKGLSSWLRGFTFEALVRQVQWGEQPREPLVQYFSGLFKTNALRNDDIAWTLLIVSCLDLHPGELLDEIRGIYERDLVDLFVVGDFDGIQHEAANDLEAHLRRGAQEHPPITDTARAVSWWGCFQRPRPLRSTVTPLPADSDSFDEEPGLTPRQEQPKIGRNDQCPCGSGKKYKKCCLPAGG
jgi:hypothetical protein